MRPLKFRAWDKTNKKWAYEGFDIFGEVTIFNLLQEYKFEEACESFEITQYTGLKDKNGKQVYEGDIIRWYHLEIEYQTHYGDNIPMGSYTEPCGVIERKYEKPVVFHEGSFTATPFTYNPEEEEVYPDACPLRHAEDYPREILDDIFYPRPYHKQGEKLSDEDFLETCQSTADSFGFEIASIEDFIQKINGFEIIGNIYENEDLISIE